MAASNRLMGPAKAHNRKFSEYTSCKKTYWKNYYLKVFLKYLKRLIYHCTIKNFMKLFKFIFHTVHNPRALLFVLCQIIISRLKNMIAQSFYSNNMNLVLHSLLRSIYRLLTLRDGILHQPSYIPCLLVIIRLRFTYGERKIW